MVLTIRWCVQIGAAGTTTVPCNYDGDFTYSGVGDSPATYGMLMGEGPGMNPTDMHTHQPIIIGPPHCPSGSVVPSTGNDGTADGTDEHLFGWRSAVFT